MKNLCKTICLLLFLFSCSNDDLIEKKVVDENCISEIQLIFEAQSFFEDVVINSVDTLIQKGNNQDEPRKKIKKTPQWDKAFIRELSFGTGVVVPLIYEKELYIRKGNSSLTLSELSYMLFYVDNKGKMKAELVTALPDETYTNSTSENQPFSGLVLVEDWHGNYLKGFLHKNEQKGNSDNSKVESENCILTEYYECTSYDGGKIWSCIMYDYDQICISGSGIGENDYTPTGGKPGTTPSPTPTPKPNLDSLINKIRELNKYDSIALNNAINELKATYCPNVYIFNNIMSSTSFLMNPGLNARKKAVYDPINKTITFRNYLSINPGTVLQEAFHAYQDMFYPGGTSQYDDKPGNVNIEFESWIFTDLWLIENNKPLGFERYLPANLGTDYHNWIFSISDNGFGTDQLNNYAYWLKKFNEIMIDYSSDTHPNLKLPYGAIQLFNICNF